MYHGKQVEKQNLGYHRKLYNEVIQPEWYMCDTKQENYQNTHTRAKLG